MRIIIKKIKYRASARFWQAVKDQSKNKYILEKFNIPQSIFDSIHSLPKKMPLYRELAEPQKKTVRDIYNVFDKLWKKHQREIERVLKKLKTTDFKRNWLKKEIPKVTGIDWPFQKIYIFPGILNWTRTRENQICVAIRPKYIFKKSEFIPMLIHELIHINTWKTKFRQKLFYKRDSEEISTALLTNKIIRAMNTEFNMNITNQKFATPFVKLEKFIPQFEKILNQSKSYQKIVFKVDNYLKKIKHKPYYT